MTIKTYEEGDSRIWIPVAKATKKYKARAFLPFAGLDGIYQHGYKADRERSPYFEAIRSVQSAYLNDTKKVFPVNNGTSAEVQHKAKWRHGSGSSPPGLGPTLGWVEVAVSELEELESEELGAALLDADSDQIQFKPQEKLAPILCSSPAELQDALNELFSNTPNGIPQGQKSPRRGSMCAKEYIVRDAQVVYYVLSVANGVCECCSTAAPFLKKDGAPYLEVHHVKYLSQDGSDRVTNAVGICPNCHMNLHYGANKNILKENLYEKVDRLIRE